MWVGTFPLDQPEVALRTPRCPHPHAQLCPSSHPQTTISPPLPFHRPRGKEEWTGLFCLLLPEPLPNLEQQASPGLCRGCVG